MKYRNTDGRFSPLSSPMTLRRRKGELRKRTTRQLGLAPSPAPLIDCSPDLAQRGEPPALAGGCVGIVRVTEISVLRPRSFYRGSVFQAGRRRRMPTLLQTHLRRFIRDGLPSGPSISPHFSSKNLTITRFCASFAVDVSPIRDH